MLNPGFINDMFVKFRKGGAKFAVVPADEMLNSKAYIVLKPIMLTSKTLVVSTNNFKVYVDMKGR